jgi:LCP family protein required for cell wall assembly
MGSNMESSTDDANKPAEAAASADTAATAAPIADEASEQPAAAKSASRWRVLIPGVLSFLWPGLGQIFMGKRRAGIVFAVPAVLFLAMALLQVATNPVLFAVSLWDESYVELVIVGLAVFGAWRVAAVLHAMFPAGFRRPWRRMEVAVAAALIAAILVVHGGVAAGAWVWYETSASIQSNNIFAVGSPTPGDPTPTDLQTPTPSPESSGAVYTAIPQPTPSPTRAPDPNRITFLVVGLDFTSGRDHSLTDTLMIVSLDTVTHEASLISVPRDTTSFPLYWGGSVANTFKLNTFLNTVSQGKLKAPDDPIVALEKEIGFLVGIPVNYYAAVDMDGFAKVIDALGGVDIYNPHAINDPSTGIILAAGPAHLNGIQAVLYARSRENGGSDYIRANRQQGMLVSLKSKLLSASVLPKFNSILSIASRSVGTDFPLKTAKNYVKAVQGVKKINMCVLGPPYSVHPPTTQTGGKWTSYLDMNLVAGVSVTFFGEDSLYYGQPGVTPRSC